MTLLLVFIFGLIVGSFLNAVIFRLATGESFLFERSHCMHCSHELSALDLIPLVSFLMLSARCRYCKAKLSWQYPLVEFLTGILFVALVINSGMVFDSNIAITAILVCFLIVIGVFDYNHYLILDKVVFPALALAIVWNIYQDVSTHYSLLTIHSHFVSGLLGASLVSGFFGLQYIISRGKWIGFGDVKFGLLLGSLFGFPNSLIMLFLAYILGAIVGVVLLALKRKNLNSQLPFGVFLSISAIIMILHGQQLTDWYLTLIGLK